MKQLRYKAVEQKIALLAVADGETAVLDTYAPYLAALAREFKLAGRKAHAIGAAVGRPYRPTPQPTLHKELS